MTVPTIDQSVLAFDGWEHHSGYHLLAAQAKRGNFVMVMPTLHMPDGDVAAWQTPYAECLAPLVDARPAVRGVGFASFARAAHRLAAKALTRNHQ